MGHLDQAEEDATRLVQPDTFLEPFALRTLGFARQDEGLLARAVERFEALGLLRDASRTWAVSGVPLS